jgi:O-antigen/teichoic acid export membrane protein
MFFQNIISANYYSSHFASTYKTLPPAEFGVYGTYIAIVSFINCFVTGRFEYAITRLRLIRMRYQYIELLNTLLCSLQVLFLSSCSSLPFIKNFLVLSSAIKSYILYLLLFIARYIARIFILFE